MKLLIIKLALTISIFIGFTISVNSSEISFEGEYDWTMYQYNGQHTGYNVHDKIDIPLELKWSRRYQVPLFEPSNNCWR